MLTTAFFCLLSFGGAAQVPPPPPPPPVEMGQPPRDPLRRPPPETKGTGMIRGRVVAADTGTPVRRATVNLSMAPPTLPVTTNAAPPVAGTQASTQTVVVNGAVTTVRSGVIVRPKTVTTDAQGAFEFSELPPGSYRLSASPSPYSAGYLAMAFGAKRPSGPGSSDPGTPIELADGQRFDRATIALVRGAVLTGRVTDENGDPLARIQIYTLMFPAGSTRGMRTGGNASTDDLGQFRMFGLLPGDYVVVAEGRGNTFVQPNAPPETEEDRIGFVTTFFPGTADDASAQRVRARAAGETPGIEIRMVSGRLFHVNGMVTDSQGRTAVRSNGSLIKRAAGGATTSTFGFNTDEQGRFQMRNIPPGDYRLTVRQQPRPDARDGDGSMREQGEFASIPVSVTADLDNLLIVTSPGATVAGTIVFEDGPPQLTGNQTSLQMRVSVVPGDPQNMTGMPLPQPVIVGPDLTFTMKGLSGELLLRAGAPGNTLKAVQVGADDVTDTPREFKTGDRVTLVMTSRAATLEGNVTDAAGKPTTDAAILLFSDDKAQWRNTSVRTRRGSADQAGHYRLANVLAGRYILVALPRDRMSMAGSPADPSFFEALAKEGTAVVVGVDEQRQVDVKVSAGGGD